MEIYGNTSSPSHDMAYFAGLVEGKLTAEYIYKQYQNTLADYCVTQTDYCGQLALFLERNQQYMSKLIVELDEDPFWYQVKKEKEPKVLLKFNAKYISSIIMMSMYRGDYNGQLPAIFPSKNLELPVVFLFVRT